MAKKATKKEGKIKSAFASSRESVPAIKDALNKIWTLTVVGVLWGSAYVIYMCSEPGVPVKVTQYLAAALFVLGLMFLFVHLKPVKTSSVIE